MNTNIPVNYSTNFSFNYPTENITWQEQGMRFCLAFPFVFIELLYPTQWQFEMLLLGLYLAFTALVRWDPVYHILLIPRQFSLFRQIKKTFSDYLSPITLILQR